MRNKGFTLIELLVVIAILGALSALLVPNFMEARKNARDTQRKNDMKQVQKALELYKLDQSPPAYPATASIATSLTAGNYIKTYPTDPISSTKYAYKYTLNSSLDYDLCACLENTSPGSGSSCASTPCSGTCTSPNLCYVLTEP